MGWNDTFDTTTKWAQVAFLNMFWTAIDERYRAVHNAHFNSVYALAAGANVGKYSTSAPATSTDIWSIRYMQDLIEGGIGGDWVATYYWTGATYTPVSDYAGKSAIQTWAFSGGTPPTITGAILGGNGWTRKYPREFANAAATVYTDGSAFANGHKARRLDDGRIYTRTAGAWVAATLTDKPDKITAYGKLKKGDYIGHWLFNEMRDVLNALLWLRRSPTNASAERVYKWVDEAGATVADAKINADAAWIASPRNDPDGDTAAHEYSAVLDGGPEALYQTRKIPYYADVQNVPFASSTDFYFIPTAAVQYNVNEYDANGNGWTRDVLNIFGATATGAGSPATPTRIDLGANAQVAWPATGPAPGSGDAYSRGWRATAIDAIERVTGFTYKP